MNIEIGELFKQTSLVLVILGAILLLIAALGGLPVGTQTAAPMDAI